MKRFFIALFLLGLTVPAPNAHAIIQGDFISGPGFYWVAGVLNFTPKGTGQCTGSFIAPDWVLTAAHCFAEEGGVNEVRLVDFPEDFDFKRYRKSTEVRANFGRNDVMDILERKHVKRVILSADSDLALVQLSSPAEQVESFAQVITPQEADGLRRKRPESVDVIVVGLGRNADLWPGGSIVLEGEFSGFLKKFYQTTLIEPTAQNSGDFFKAYSKSNFYENHYTTPNGPGSIEGRVYTSMANPGDSGGPLMTLVNGEWKLIGVSSQGQGSRYARFIEWLTGKNVMFEMLHSVKVDLFMCDLIAQTGGELTLPGYGECGI